MEEEDSRKFIGKNCSKEFMDCVVIVEKKKQLLSTIFILSAKAGNMIGLISFQLADNAIAKKEKMILCIGY